jgi:hypothetical protein
MNSQTIYVITWEYSDGSASGIMGAYSKAPMADYILSLLKSADSGRYFTLHQVALVMSDTEGES